MNERKEPSFGTPISSNPETNEIGNGHEYTGNATIETQPYEKIEFTGAAREYFGIWIVNIILSVCTLGIYSAWAKVEEKRILKTIPGNWGGSEIMRLVGKYSRAD